MIPIKIRQLNSSDADFRQQLASLRTFNRSENAAVGRSVAQILADIKVRGDVAVLDYTKRFDRLEAASVAALELPAAALQTALDHLEPKQRAALEVAAARIRAYHEKQKIECGSHNWHYTEADGTVLGQRIAPIDRVGIYVPGGKAAYPSSVLMNALPAQIARVREIVMMVPTPDGVRNDLVLAAARLSGVNRVFTIGGAQAIGALAYGTVTVPAVDKIVGPGNAYVAAAKRRVFGTVGIDMIAGPSEIVVLCDGTAEPRWVATDLCAQAEHDEWAQAILLCPHAVFIDSVNTALTELIDELPRATVVRASLEGRGALIKVRDMEEACAIANQMAPEHLEISATNPQQWLQQIRHAGAIFVGHYTSESLGDYCAGPNHVLPTARTARFSSPLGVYDFIKRSSLIEVSAEGAHTLGEVAVELAYSEGLQAHAKSAEYRMQGSEEDQGSRKNRARSNGGAPDQICSLKGGQPMTTISRVIRSEVLTMSRYPVPDATGLVKLDAMENPFSLPVELAYALGQQLGAVALNRYPASRPEALIDKLKRVMHVPASCDLLLGNGSDELIGILSAACAKQDAKVIAPVPSFVMYQHSAMLAGLEFIGVPLTTSLELEVEALLAAICEHQPALIYLAYPNNPTGTLYSDHAIERVITAAPNSLIVLDEAYQPFAQRSWLPRITDFNNLVVMRTMSKLGLAGIRLGYLAGVPAWLNAFDKVRPPYNINVLTQAAADFLLDHIELFDRQAKQLRDERARLSSALAALPCVTVFPSAGNFVLLRVPNAATAFDALLNQRILVKNVTAMHPLLTNCLRVTVGAPNENAQLLTALRRVLV